MQGGATLLSRPEVCMFLGPVGDVLCGTAQRRKIEWGHVSPELMWCETAWCDECRGRPMRQQALLFCPPLPLRRGVYL